MLAVAMISTVTNPQVTGSLGPEVWNGLPEITFSNCGSCFVSSFWNSLCQHLKIQHNLSTAYHPDDWIKWFLISEFDHNNRNFESISKQPVNATKNKPTSFDSNLLLSALVILKLGPFKIEPVLLKNAFKLSLPLKWKAIHPAFHVLLLEPAKGLYMDKTHPSPETVNIQDHLEWEVSPIVNSRLCKGKLPYLVEWADSPDLVQEFHSNYPHKPFQL
ncbi:uncharacterized protein VP01_2720g3 [Puccinia sorghi]|uniref:Integrase catalytic domain-containing protein n=1 Tax=Puccinia sorghi TaxID=27349 RepID=A0A0L6V426_9BASI|nr:uncharacterized protein VP01_2720g3 [Puccinia sorghi]